ncbi:vegetative cell wall protein gp1 [Abeliophyllum distichum]|uniref:Vegetative cell wall protein gp1 n=1 Tax=Abeliophyllum distichum TaxID=126358 RepID=A0ABD1TEV2_9LAMI
MASQQPRPSWFRFPFMLRSANPPEAPVTRPPAPRAPPPLPQPAFMRPAPPPVASPPPPAALAPPAPVPSIPRSQTETPPPRSPAAAPPRSPVAPTAAPPRSPVAPTAAPRPAIPRSQTANPPPRSPPPAPVASPPPTVAPIPTSITRSPVAPPTASPPPRSPSVSSPKYPIGKTSASLLPTPAPKESQKTFTIPASPKTKEQVPSSSIPTPVVQKPMIHSPTPTAESSPKVVKLSKRTLVQSPQSKPVPHPSSPLELPSPQMKTATDREPKITAIFNGKRETTKDKGVHIKHSESEEYRMSAITLSGQNKGAIMELSASGPQSLDKNGNIISWTNGDKSSSGEGKFAEDKTHEEIAVESPQMTAYMNSNVQGINNSIFYNCSSTHNDPGIHLSLSRKKDQWD